VTRPTDFSYSGTELEAVAEAKSHYQWIVEDLAGSLEANSVISVNVPEHVEEDAHFLDAARAALAPGGSLLEAGWSGLNYH
jgi:2-polyprenyl-3-methyl-5-hydroxy-6-metoxy-1,4-benzoquinol methylase